MQLKAEATLRRIVEQMVVALGTPPDYAPVIAESLVGANLTGHDSHGVLRLPWYANLIKLGRIVPSARPSVADLHAATGRIDGMLGWGQPAASLGAETAIGLAAEYGVAAVVLTRTNHIGRVGAYVEQIANANMVGIALCNASALVAPFGSSQRVLGTNPFAWAAPGGPGKPPIVLDFATSIVAEGKLRVARAKGELLEPGLIVDAQGWPSIDPVDFYSGGALQAFGLHKGSGLSVMVELMARGIANVNHSMPGVEGYNGTLILALNIAALAPLEQFLSASLRLGEQINAATPRRDVEQVLLPGQPENLARTQRRTQGIPIPDATWAEIVELAESLGVDTTE